MIFLYFPLLGLRFFSFWVGAWVWDLSSGFTVLVSVWVSGFAPLGFGSLLGHLTVDIWNVSSWIDDEYRGMQILSS